MLCYRVNCVLLLLSTTQVRSKASVTVVFDEDIRECENGLPLPAVDLSQLEIIHQEDGTSAANGSAMFTDDYGHPWAWKFHTKRLERGQWVTGIASRQMMSFCPLIQAPNEIWYKFTSRLEQKTCPYKKGHVEHLDMLSFGNMAEILELPQEFVGEWRFYNEIATTRKGSPIPVQECFMIPAMIMEM